VTSATLAAGRRRDYTFPMRRYGITLGAAVPALAVFLALRFVVFDVYVIEGASMEPGLPPGTVVLVLRAAFAGDAAPGEVVCAGSAGQKIVKRVAAAGPAVVAWKNGAVYINGTVVDRFRHRPQLDIPGSCRVAPDALFLLGDNMNASSDSRATGAVPRSAIRGRVVWAVFPFSLFGEVR